MGDKTAGEERAQLEIFCGDLREYLRRAPFATDHREGLRVKLKEQQNEIAKIVGRGFADMPAKTCPASQDWPDLLDQLLLPDSLERGDLPQLSERVLSTLREVINSGAEQVPSDSSPMGDKHPLETRKPKRWAF